MGADSTFGETHFNPKQMKDEDRELAEQEYQKVDLDRNGTASVNDIQVALQEAFIKGRQSMRSEVKNLKKENQSHSFTELYPCPFCGSDPMWVNKALADDHFYIKCPNCHIVMKEDRRDKVVGMWNSRNASEKANAEISRLRSELEKFDKEDEFRATPKNKKPLEDRLRDVSEKLKNNYSVKSVDYDLYEAYKLGAAEILRLRSEVEEMSRDIELYESLIDELRNKEEKKDKQIKELTEELDSLSGTDIVSAVQFHVKRLEKERDEEMVKFLYWIERKTDIEITYYAKPEKLLTQFRKQKVDK